MIFKVQTSIKTGNILGAEDVSRRFKNRTKCFFIFRNAIPQFAAPPFVFLLTRENLSQMIIYTQREQTRHKEKT